MRHKLFSVFNITTKKGELSYGESCNSHIIKPIIIIFLKSLCEQFAWWYRQLAYFPGIGKKRLNKKHSGSFKNSAQPLKKDTGRKSGH